MSVISKGREVMSSNTKQPRIGEIYLMKFEGKVLKRLGTATNLIHLYTTTRITQKTLGFQDVMASTCLEG